MEKSSKKMPELVLKSSVKTVENEVEKSASGSKVIENENGNFDASTPVVKNENSAKKEIVIAENPLRNFSSVKKNENNNSKNCKKRGKKKRRIYRHTSCGNGSKFSTIHQRI